MRGFGDLNQVKFEVSSGRKTGDILWVILLCCTLYAPAKKKEAKNYDLQPRKVLAEVHGNRTHLPPYSEGTPDLKDECPG